MRWRLLALLCAAAALRPHPARAEALTLSLSSDRVAIGSNFSGADLVAFGIIERDVQTVARPGRLDVVLTVTGPRESLTIRRKEAIGPVWLNRSQYKFFAVPSLIGTYSTAPLATVATPNFRRRYRLGVEPTLSARGTLGGPDLEDTPFRDALIRLKRREGLYTDNPKGVVFVTDLAFRSTIALPAIAPIGRYEIEASLLSDGVEVARQMAGFELVKVGFEERVTELARDRALEYGMATAATALLFGWFATVIFRRD